MSPSRWRPVAVAGRLVLVLAALDAAIQLAHGQGDIKGPDVPPRRMVVRLSGELIAPLVERPIDELAAVDDVILGTHVKGQARVTAQPSLELADDANCAAFTVRLSGIAHSRTVGRSGPAILHCRGETKFDAAKRVAFDPLTGFVAEPAQVKATTKNTTERIESTVKGLVESFIVDRAWSQVAANRPQIDAVVREKAELQVAREFDRMVEARLVQFNRSLPGGLAMAAVLGSHGATDFACSTSGGYLQIAASVGRVGPLELPTAGNAPTAIQIWLEDSVLTGLPVLTLRRLEGLRGLGLATRTYRMMPLAQMPGGRELARLSPLGPVNFASSGDWIVLQLGFQPGKDDHVAAKP